MVLGLLASLIGGLFGWSMALLSLFLILLVLVQRGRGGGLTGALGGPGGQSAFGSKAGDMFTRITFVVAGVWILLCALAMWTLGNARTVVTVPPEGVIGETNDMGGGVVPPTPAPPGAAPAGGMPDLSGLGDLSDLIGEPPAEGDAEAPDAAEVPADETPDADTPDADTPDAGTPDAPAPAEPPADSAEVDDAVTEVPVEGEPAAE